jgi:hypothetical protein
MCLDLIRGVSIVSIGAGKYARQKSLGTLLRGRVFMTISAPSFSIKCVSLVVDRTFFEDLSYPFRP